MKKPTDPSKILCVFAQYGFRRVSMHDIAKAAGLSRQSIYNQYGSKENVLDNTVMAFLSDVMANAIAALNADGEKPQDVLMQAFQAAIGDHIWILEGSPHGGEILDMAMESVKRADTDYRALFSDAVAKFLLTHGLRQTPQAASDAAFAMDAAARGILRSSETTQDFRHGMLRVLNAFLNTGETTNDPHASCNPNTPDLTP